MIPQQAVEMRGFACKQDKNRTVHVFFFCAIGERFSFILNHLPVD